MPAKEEQSAPVPASKPRSRDWIWVVVAVSIWFFNPLLKLQIARITPFDLLIGGILGFAVLNHVMGWGKKKTGPRWKIQNSPTFYLSLFAVICAGFFSGLHAGDVKLWIIEVITFVYVGVMLVSVDLFTTHQLERFLKIGAWTFAGICAITGVISTTYLLGGPKLEWFFEVSLLKGSTDKFTGFVRFANQWSGYVVAMFPLLLALSFEKLKTWQKPLLAVCALLGALTVPASGSRSGIFLLAAEVVGFLIFYLAFNRSGKILNRVLYLTLFFVVVVGSFWMVFEQISDDPIIKRSLGAFELVFEQEQFSDDWRDYNRAAALNEFEKHPLIGIGLGTFELYYDRHEIHSSYLSILTETGIAGIFPYIFLVTLPVFQLLRSIALHISHGKNRIMLVALLIAIGSQLLFAIHHNNTRHRHVWLLMLMGMLYAELTIAELKSQIRGTRSAKLNKRLRRLQRAAGPTLTPRPPR